MKRLALLAALPLVPLLAACGDDGSTGTGGSGGSGGSGGAGAGGGSALEDFVVGGDRPVTVHVPSGYSPDTPAPLLILLHGYSAAGNLQEVYFQLAPGADARGMLYAYPDGTIDSDGKRFWNATDVCCNLYGATVDDSAYLIGLVDEIAQKANVDPKRVYFVGHSNGGFMSHRMACDHADRVAAIVSLAGTTYLDEQDCGATEPVSVMHVHGDADDTVPYEGGGLAGLSTLEIPGAAETVARWAARATCEETPTAGARQDIDGSLPGEETSVLAYTGCDPGVGAELWTIEGGGHVPGVNDAFREAVLDFLLAHPKP